MGPGNGNHRGVFCPPLVTGMSSHESSMPSFFSFWVVFRHELRSLKADRVIGSILVALSIAAGYGVINGKAWVEKQQFAMEAAGREEQSRLAENLHKLTAMQKGEYIASTAFRNPANPLWIGNRHAATYAILPPAPLAPTAIGQSDLNLSYILISADSKETFAFNEEIENPGNLLIGHFDLAFFIVYLFPLFIIALSYNALSAEREQGTLAILMANPIRLSIVFLAKLGCRAGLLILPLVAITVGFVFLDDTFQLFSIDAAVRLAWWTGLVVTYALFWFSVTAAVSVQGKSSEHNVLVLVGLWVMFSLIVPTLLTVAVNLAYPVPSRGEMINSLRAIQTDTSKEYDASAARYEEEHAAMSGSNGILNEKDLKAARKRVLVQQNVARLTENLLTQHNDQLMRQQRVVDTLAFLSPAILMQEGLNDIAGTGNSRYQHFMTQVDRFYVDWQMFFIPKVMKNTALTPEDYNNFPRFHYEQQPLSDLNARLIYALFWLSVPTILLGGLVARRISHYPITT